METLVVSAADHRFFRTLWQMLRDAERHRLERAHPFAVFDLGFTVGDRRILAARFPWCELRGVAFDRYPPHVRNLSLFAWKPVVVSEIVDAMRCLVLWLDSATLFRG